MKKPIYIFISLFSVLSLTACENYHALSLSDTKSKAESIYSAQEEDTDPLYFTVNITDYQSNADKNETLTTETSFVVDMRISYYHYYVISTNQSDVVSQKYESFGYVLNDSYIVASNDMNQRPAATAYYQFNDYEGYISNSYSLLIGLAYQYYSGLILKPYLFDSTIGVFNTDTTTNYDYLNIEGYSTGDGSLLLKYRSVDKYGFTSKAVFTWSHYYLTNLELVVSSSTSYHKLTASFSNRARREYPDLTSYTLVN